MKTTLTLALLSTLVSPTFASPAGPGNNKIQNCLAKLQTKFESIALIDDMKRAQKYSVMRVDVQQRPSAYNEEELVASEKANQEAIMANQKLSQSLLKERTQLRVRKGAVLNRQEKVNKLSKRIAKLTDQRRDLFKAKNEITEKLFSLKLAQNPALMAPRIKKVHVKMLTGEKLKAHYQENPLQRDLDQENDYIRFQVSKYSTFDHLSEQDIVEAKKRHQEENIVSPTGVSFGDFYALVDKNQIDTCTIKRIYTDNL